MKKSFLFRNFLRRLKLLWYVLRKDKDYDSSYLYQLLYIKFSNMVDYFETDEKYQKQNFNS